MATIVTYNGVTLNNVTTREGVQESVYDQSGVDLLYTKYRMQFEGIFCIPWGSGERPPIDANKPGGGAGSASNWITWIADTQASEPSFGDTATAQYTGLRDRLMQPRKELIVTMGSASKPILNVPEPVKGQVGVEVSAGPHPQDIQIIHVSANKVFRILYTIECEVTSCGTSFSTGAFNLVLSNRWSVQEQMDKNFFTTRRVKGRIRFSSADRQWQALRGLAFPALESGFRRTSYQYEVLANGLEADYTIVDSQTTTAAPWPATSIDGSYTESTVDGIQFFSDVRVTLEAPPHVSRTLLIARGAQIIENRLQLEVQGGGGIPQNIRLDGATITEQLGESNAITMAMRVYRVGEDPGRFLAALRTGTIGRRLTLPVLSGHRYNSQISPTPPLWGHKLKFADGRRRPQDFLFKLHCFLQGPCVDLHSIVAGRDLSPAPPYATDSPAPGP